MWGGCTFDCNVPVSTGGAQTNFLKTNNVYLNCVMCNDLAAWADFTLSQGTSL